MRGTTVIQLQRRCVSVTIGGSPADLRERLQAPDTHLQ